MESKIRQRQESLALVRMLTRAERAAKSAAIARNLLAHPLLRESRESGPSLVLAFAALPSEPDLSSLPLEAPHLQFCLPRVVDPHRLAVHLVPDFGNLVRSDKGIAEPDPARHPEVPPTEIDIILLPGLAFSTLTGHRLGRGAGCYDRFLALPDLARAHRIGVCFDSQTIPRVPAEPHDARVDEIITDSRHIRPDHLSPQP